MSSLELSASPVLLRALRELDFRLRTKVRPFELKVVGGGAMLLGGISQYHNQYTDIDYIGENLENFVEQDAIRIIQEVGLEFNLGKHWINNDVILPGTDLEDIEYTTGELHFEIVEEMEVITVYALVPTDILRMKAIAVDTQLSVIGSTGEFTRKKDWADIREISEYLGLDKKGVTNIIDCYMYDPFSIKVINKICSTSNDCEGDNEVEEFIKTKYPKAKFY